VQAIKNRRWIVQKEKRDSPHISPGLRQVTEAQCWQPWILYMLHAIERTARENRDSPHISEHFNALCSSWQAIVAR